MISELNVRPSCSNKVVLELLTCTSHLPAVSKLTYILHFQWRWCQHKSCYLIFPWRWCQNKSASFIFQWRMCQNKPEAFTLYYTCCPARQIQGHAWAKANPFGSTAYETRSRNTSMPFKVIPKWPYELREDESHKVVLRISMYPSWFIQRDNCILMLLKTHLEEVTGRMCILQVLVEGVAV